EEAVRSVPPRSLAPARGRDLSANADRVGVRTRRRSNVGQIPPLHRRRHCPVVSCCQSDRIETRRGGTISGFVPCDYGGGVSPGRCKCGKAAFQIGNQVLDVLEADVQAHGWATRHPFCCRPDVGAVEWNGQALEASPRWADAEEVERVDEGVDRALRDWLEYD